MMRRFDNFTPYTPENGEYLAILKVNDTIRFLRTPEGVDWYECQKLFRDDTVKVIFDKTGVITAFSTDVSTLCPAWSSVVEVSAEDVPKDLSIAGGWLFTDGQIKQKEATLEECKARAIVKKHKLLQSAAVLMAPYLDAESLGMATDEEASTLLKWRSYRVLLNRVDTDNPGSIDWPTPPA